MYVTSQFVHGRTFEQRSDPTSLAALRAPGGPCDSPVLALLQWTLQVRALAHGIASLSRERLSILLFSECLELSWATALSIPEVPVRIRETHSLSIQQPVEALRLFANRTGCRWWTSRLMQTLHKWEIMSLTFAKVAVFLDLDVEVLPHVSLRMLEAQRGLKREDLTSIELLSSRDWLELLQCLARSRYAMLATPGPAV